MIYKIWFSPDNYSKEGIQSKMLKPQDYRVDAAYSYTTYSQGEKIKSEVLLPRLEKVPTASMTDYISAHGINSFFMLVSGRLKALIKGISVPIHQFVEVSVKDDLKEHQYFGLHFNESSTNDLIDWQNSCFNIVERRTNIIEEGLCFENLDSFTNEFRRIGLSTGAKHSLRPSELVLNTEIDKDLFYSTIPLLGLFCSSKFVELIESNNISGFRFEEVKTNNL